MQSMLTIRQPTAAMAVQGGGEHLGRVAAAVLRIGVGKHLPDVAQGGGPQQGVGDGVQEGVGVAVADGLAVVRDVDAAQPQAARRAAGGGCRVRVRRVVRSWQGLLVRAL